MNTSEEKAKPPEKTKALCVATRCSTVEQFVATFHKFCDDSSFFVATLATRPVGLETAFSIQLEDKTPVLRGLCVVVEAWSTPANRFGRPGVRLNVRRLTNESLPVFKQLQAARMSAEAAERVAKPIDPNAIAANGLAAKPVEARGSSDAIGAKPAEVVGAKPVDTKPDVVTAKPFEPKPIDAKPKSLADKLAEIKATPKPPATPPPRKTDGIPPIPSTIPKISPTAFAAKPALPSRPATPTPSIIVEIDEPTKIEAKTAVRAEGTAPVTRADAPSWDTDITANAKTLDVKNGAQAGNAQPVPLTVEANPVDTKPVVVEAKPVEAKPIDAKPQTPAQGLPATAESPTHTGPAPTFATSAPTDVARSTQPLRGANVTTPAIGISTSTVNLSNAALTAEDTAAQAPSYPEVTARDVGTGDRDAPEAIAASDDMTSPVASESRAPGSSFVLPANPLMNLSDKSLEGFVDCALYEETGNFFRAPGYEDSLVDIDDVAAPPGALSPVQAIRPGDEVSQAAYVLTPTTPMVFTSQPQQPFNSELTPIPMLQGRTPTTPPYAQQPYPTGQMPPVQYAQNPVTGQMQLQYAPSPYPTGQMPPIQYPTGQMPPVAVNAPNRRRWMIIGGAAMLASIVLLVIVIVTRGDNKTATAATPPAKPEKKSDTVTMAVTTQTQTPTTPDEGSAKPPPKAPTTPDDDEHAVVGDPNAPPTVGSGPCKLTVTTTPAGSIVRLDDQVMGPSPITINGACARRRVDVKHPRYSPGLKWVTLSEDKPATVDIPLSRPTHSVTVVTQPAGATISIGGKRAGTTPTAVQMMGFTKVALTIEKKGYKTVVESIYSKSDGERRTVTLTRIK